MESLRRSAPVGRMQEFNHGKVGNKETPLHTAAFAGQLDEIEILLREPPSSEPAVEKDSQGRLPLHCACSSPGSVRGPAGPADGQRRSLRQASAGSRRGTKKMLQVIRVLVQAYPQGLFCKDCNGHKPIDLAVRNSRASEDIVEYLRTSMQKLSLTVSQTSSEEGNTKDSDSHDQPEEIPREVIVVSTVKGGSYDDDDISTLGWDGGRKHNKDGSAKLSKGLSVADIVADPNFTNSKEVLEKCWFV